MADAKPGKLTAQIPLDLSLPENHSLKAFVIGDANREAFSAVTEGQWTANALAISGPKGCGKTHLGHIWAAQTQAKCLSGSENFNPSRDLNGGYIWLDEAAVAEEFTLFALVNMAISGELAGLLLTDRLSPTQWGVIIPDLRSRLGAVPNIPIAPAEDVLLLDIIDKLFMDRGLKVTAPLAEFLMNNTERSVDALRKLIAELDEAAAAQKVNVTRSFAAKFLQRDLL